MALMLLGAAPLLLHTVFGPADGNPLHLAMLAAVLVPIGFLLLGIGALKWLIAKAHRLNSGVRCQKDEMG